MVAGKTLATAQPQLHGFSFVGIETQKSFDCYPLISRVENAIIFL
jgi:hypothetical protein